MARVFTVNSFGAGGGEYSFTIPVNTRAIALQAETGEVYEHATATKGDDFWPIGTGQKESTIARDEAGSILYFTGAANAVLYIRTTTGLGS